jgi:hypothetical protein
MDKKCPPINKKSPFVGNWGKFLAGFDITLKKEYNDKTEKIEI